MCKKTHNLLDSSVHGVIFKGGAAQIQGGLWSDHPFLFVLRKVFVEVAVN